MDRVFKRIIIAPFLTSNDDVDVICTTRPLDYTCIVNYLTTRGIAFKEATEQQAYAFLMSRDETVGVGCYIGNPCNTSNAYRIAMATAKYNGLARQVGIKRIGALDVCEFANCNHTKRPILTMRA